MAKFLPEQAQHGRGFSLTLQGRELRRVKTQCKHELENNGVSAMKDIMKGERLGANKPGCGGVTVGSLVRQKLYRIVNYVSTQQPRSHS